MDSYVMWVSLALAIASFAIFARLALRPAPKPVPPGQTAEIVPHGGIDPAAGAGERAEQFAKAGPMATAASLSVVFLLIALMADGLISFSVN